MDQPLTADSSAHTDVSSADASPDASTSAVVDVAAKPASGYRSTILRWLAAVGVAAIAMALARLTWPSGGSVLQGSFQDAMASSLWLGLGVSWLAGVGTSLTPCVYPMIVVTVSVFGAREAKTRLSAAMLSTMFVLGIACMFTPMGLIAGAAGGQFGTWLANPFVVGGIALVFCALAASMFGAFEMTLPASLQNRLASVGGAGYLGAFVLGLVSGVIAAPCTGPVLNAIIVWVATTRNMVIGGAVLFAFSLGLGLLFWLVGTFSIALPKSGKWMLLVKSTFGIVMVTMALYYARTLVPAIGDAMQRSDVLWVATGAAVLLGIGLGAVDLSFSGRLVERLRKGVGIALVVAGAFGLIGYASAEPPGARVAWHEETATAHAKITRARENGLPVLVDFGAEWCGACGELDRHTFSDARVVSESRRFQAVRIDATRMSDEIRGLFARYRVRGLPVVLLIDGSGQERERIVEFVEPDDMLRRMRAVR
ncbi:MAG: thioredoxin family protein [Deltaproteobacteria bacterium]|nr:thioredoxin family protein [Deltaproteobacteria bacterium]